MHVRGLTGDPLVYTDIRADNVLRSPQGTVTIVDWPWVCRGPAWLDTLVLINARLYGGHDTHALLINFVDTARRPPPKGLPTLRAFQRAQADTISVPAT
jgi:Ser/Thr protein kinase RdoA (MazF antagonist)